MNSVRPKGFDLNVEQAGRPPVVAGRETSPGLSRRLGLSSAILIVLGSIIGSGIFLTPQNIAATVQIPGLMGCSRSRAR
jgi:hypothetical protein